MSKPTSAPRTLPVQRHARRQNSRVYVALFTAALVFGCFQLGAGLWMQAGAERDREYGWLLERFSNRVKGVGSDACKVIVLGSSRVLDGVRARELDAPLSAGLGRPVVVVNFGMVAAGPLMELLNWQRLREDGVRPDLVVIEVVPVFLSEADLRFELGQDRLPVNRLRRSDLPLFERYASDVRPEVRQQWRIERLNPVYAHRLTILGRFAPALVPFDLIAPDMPEETPLTEPDADDGAPERRAKRLRQAQAGFEKPLRRFRLGGRNCAALRELLASCRQDGVPSAVLAMPEGPVFRSWYAPGAYDEIHAWLDSVCGEFGSTLIDARAWMPGEESFRDSHHLTPVGAARFTERLGKEQLLPLLRNGGHL